VHESLLAGLGHIRIGDGPSGAPPGFSIGGSTGSGPPIWICGDCHVGNLGPLAHSDGRVEIQIRDLDQTVIGNPTHDIVRLGLSLASAARGSDLPGVTTARILEQIIEGYAGAMKLGRSERRMQMNESED
jgi:uncharacterized protein (DUF2252 family)